MSHSACNNMVKDMSYAIVCTRTIHPGDDKGNINYIIENGLTDPALLDRRMLRFLIASVSVRRTFLCGVLRQDFSVRRIPLKLPLIAFDRDSRQNLVSSSLAAMATATAPINSSYLDVLKCPPSPLKSQNFRFETSYTLLNPKTTLSL